mgnify:CR=1 FL=1
MKRCSSWENEKKSSIKRNFKRLNCCIRTLLCLLQIWIQSKVTIKNIHCSTWTVFSDNSMHPHWTKSLILVNKLVTTPVIVWWRYKASCYVNNHQTLSLNFMASSQTVVVLLHWCCRWPRPHKISLQQFTVVGNQRWEPRRQIKLIRLDI